MKGKKLDEIDLNGIRLKSRIVISSVGSGIWNWDGSSWPWTIINAKKVGAVISKTFTIEKRAGHSGIDPQKPKSKWNQIQWLWQMWRKRSEVIQKNSYRTLNCVGLRNPGIKYYFEKIYPKTKGISKIISIAGDNIEEYRAIIRIIKREKERNDLGIVAIELNADSCPSAKEYFKEISDFQELCEQAKQEAGEIPLILKLSPKHGWLERALIAEKSGFNAIHAINSLPIKNKSLLLKSEIVGQSGPSIKYIAQGIISELVGNLNIPVIGGGGVSSKKDVREFLDIGALVVNITTFCYTHPLRAACIVRKYWKKQNKLKQIKAKL